MKLADEIIVSAPKDQVYAALNDPEMLKQRIPGYEELIQHSGTELAAKVVLKVGSVKSRFKHGRRAKSLSSSEQRFGRSSVKSNGE